MLPDRSILIGQKLVENAEIQNFKCDILSSFLQCVYGQLNNTYCGRHLQENTHQGGTSTHEKY